MAHEQTEGSQAIVFLTFPSDVFHLKTICLTGELCFQELAFTEGHTPVPQRNSSNINRNPTTVLRSSSFWLYILSAYCNHWK